MTKEELIIYAIRTSEAIKEEIKPELIDYVSNLQQENQKYKEVIDKMNNYIKQHSNNGVEYLDTWEIKELLDILNRWNK